MARATTAYSLTAGTTRLSLYPSIFGAASGAGAKAALAAVDGDGLEAEMAYVGGGGEGGEGGGGGGGEGGGEGGNGLVGAVCNANFEMVLAVDEEGMCTSWHLGTGALPLQPLA